MVRIIPPALVVAPVGVQVEGVLGPLRVVAGIVEGLMEWREDYAENAVHAVQVQGVSELVVPLEDPGLDGVQGGNDEANKQELENHGYRKKKKNNKNNYFFILMAENSIS